MADSARVDSLDTLKDLRVSLCLFADTVKVALAEAETEIQRTLNWLKQDQHRYWHVQIQKRAELVTRAKIALKQKQDQKTPLGGRYSCVDEKKALALAQRRYEEAETKLANVKRWTRELEQEAFNCKSMLRGLDQAVESDLPTALAQLDNMIAALASYMSLPGATGEEAMSRPMPEPQAEPAQAEKPKKPDRAGPAQDDPAHGPAGEDPAGRPCDEPPLPEVE